MVGLGCMRLSTEPDRDEATSARRAARGARRRRDVPRHRRRVLLGRRRARSQRTAHRPGARDLDGRSIAHPGRHQGRAHAARTAAGRPTAAPNTSPAPAKTAARARRRAHSISISFTRPDPRTPLADERPRAGGPEARRPHRRDRSLQRDGRPDRGGEADHRDRLDPGRVEPLARRALSQRRRRATASPTACGSWPTVHSAGRRRRHRTMTDPTLERGRRTPRRHAVRDRAGVARRISPTSSCRFRAPRRSRRRSRSRAHRRIS